MGAIEPGLGIVQLQDAVKVMGGVPLDQIQLSLATLENNVMRNPAPLVVVSPGFHLEGLGASEVIRAAQVVHVVVQPDMVTVILGDPGSPEWAGNFEFNQW